MTDVSDLQHRLILLDKLCLIEFVIVQYTFVVTPPLVGEPSIVMSVSVCLSVRSHTSVCTRPNFTNNFLCMLTVAVARASCGGSAICYELPFRG